MAACSDPNVVVKPVGFRNIPEALLREEPAANCGKVEPGTIDVDVEHVIEAGKCQAADASLHRSKFRSIVAAVRKRQALQRKAEQAAQ